MTDSASHQAAAPDPGTSDPDQTSGPSNGVHKHKKKIDAAQFEVSTEIDLWDPQHPLPPMLTQLIDNLVRFGVSTADQELVVAAFRYAAEKHRKHIRKDGTPYIFHPLEVAKIISDYIGDPEMLAAAILHDTLEDCKDEGVTFDELSSRFTPDVARMVDGVTKLSKMQATDATERMAESTKKMLYAMAQDIRVLLIKLADRLHNMRTLEHLRQERQQAISQETLDFYAPLAHRLGMHRLKSELEDQAFKYLFPTDYRQLSEQVAMKRGDRDRIITEAVSAVKTLLNERGIACSVKGRAKHLYSIWKKMERDALTFDQLYDLYALRVVIAGDDEGDCYRVLGLIHAVWQPIYEKLKDYIGRPKSNGYQSLHTVVIGPEGRPLEVQIRTEKMDKLAEYGIAAHFLYKENRGGFSEIDQKLNWLRNLLDWEQEEQPGAEKYMEGLKTNLITEEVLVFTPKGDVMSLPVGSTPIDFAFHVHTDVGYSTRQAMVNGKVVPLNTRLNNGDIVEVFTKKGAKAPSRDWLSFVKSGRAASKIRAYYKKLDFDVNVASGKEDLAKEEKRAGLVNLRLLSEASLRKLLPDLELKNLESLYAAVGRGDISPKQVVDLLRQRYIKELKSRQSVAKSEGITSRISLAGTAGSFGVIIDGLADLTIHLSRCCMPVHGDPIVGYVTKDKGVAIHRAECHTIQSRQIEEGRLLPAQWSEKPMAVFLGSLDLWVLDRVGLLSDVTATVADAQVSVAGLKITLAKDKTARMRLRVQVRSVEELQRVQRRLLRIPDVLEVKRATGM
ncbi:MAG: GTP pyrophosphokinase [bacterium]|nr:GTP pyrophosphokinase [bacterium]